MSVAGFVLGHRCPQLSPAGEGTRRDRQISLRHGRWNRGEAPRSRGYRGRLPGLYHVHRAWSDMRERRRIFPTVSGC